MIGLFLEKPQRGPVRDDRSNPRRAAFKYSPSGSMGRRNLPCSTVNAQTENSTGARLASSNKASSRVSESLPPDSATATRSPSRIILKRPTASPTLRRSVFRDPFWGPARRTQVIPPTIFQRPVSNSRLKFSPRYTRRTSGSLPSASGVPERKDLAVVDDVGAIRHRQRLAHVVIGHQNADAGVLQIEDDPLQLQHLNRIDARRTARPAAGSSARSPAIARSPRAAARRPKARSLCCGAPSPGPAARSAGSFVRAARAGSCAASAGSPSGCLPPSACETPTLPAADS